MTYAKVYRTNEIPNPFFREIAKLLLEVGYVHVNAYGMPKQKTGVIIDTFEGRTVHCGVITGPPLREGMHTYHANKNLRPIIQQYLTILFPPRGLPTPQPSKPTPPPRSAKQRSSELATTEREEEPQHSHPVVQPTQPQQPATTVGASTMDEQELKHNRESPWPKRPRLDRKDGYGLVKDTAARVNASAPTEPMTTLEIIRGP